MRFGSITLRTSKIIAQQWYIPEWLFPIAIDYINQMARREMYPDIAWLMEYIDLQMDRQTLPLEYRHMPYPSKFIMNAEQYREYLTVREYQVVYTKKFGGLFFCNN